MQLYHIANEYQAAFDALQEMELSPEAISDSLAALGSEFEERAKSVAAYIQNLKAEAEQVKAAKNKMLERLIKLMAKVDYFEKYLLVNMRACEKNKISTPEFCISIRKNPHRLIVKDYKKLEQYPELWEMIPETPELNTELLKGLLKDGIEYEGAHLEQTERLQFS